MMGWCAFYPFFHGFVLVLETLFPSFVFLRRSLTRLRRIRWTSSTNS
jgi:hypothetical protein